MKELNATIVELGQQAIQAEEERDAALVLVAELEKAVLSLISVAEDCAAHDLYVAEGDVAVAEFRKLSPGRYTDQSAGDHFHSAAEAIRAARKILNKHKNKKAGD